MRGDESLVLGMLSASPLPHDALMIAPTVLSASRTSSVSFAAALLGFLALHATPAAASEHAKAAKLLELDSAHILAARAAGFGFSLREISFPARCVGEDKARGNVIALTVESDRTAAWADVACEHKLFENKRLQNGWTLARVSVERRCEVREGDSWKALSEESCELDVSAPAVGSALLETRVRGRLKGSGPIVQQARRLEVTYRFTLTGPVEMSPWAARR